MDDGLTFEQKLIFIGYDFEIIRRILKYFVNQYNAVLNTLLNWNISQKHIFNKMYLQRSGSALEMIIINIHYVDCQLDLDKLYHVTCSYIQFTVETHQVYFSLDVF